ncbi:tRNA pseudouridine(38-40) synthase TruA [Sphingobacteriaceae bacterium]|nr:tRNA pseudouridine(38-40) synthase TruA [Sphingobacteriaceae bacterium]
MARFFLTLSYNGTNFNGWQIQENTASTVEQVLEEKLSMLLKEKIDLVGCGRTDSGVHAKNYVAHFDSHCVDLIENKDHWIYKFNTILPPTIAIQNIQKVKDTSHARFEATQRVYYYYVNQHKNPFRDSFSWYVYGELDFEVMNRAAATLLEYEDFTSFSKVNTQNKTNNCKITKAVWQKSAEHEWRFTISADRFLRGMVRAIVGTLVMVGKNKITISDFKKIIEAKDRRVAGNNAPANALFLTGIKYPKEIFE